MKGRRKSNRNICDFNVADLCYRMNLPLSSFLALDPIARLSNDNGKSPSNRQLRARLSGSSKLEVSRLWACIYIGPLIDLCRGGAAIHEI